MTSAGAEIDPSHPINTAIGFVVGYGDSPEVWQPTTVLGALAEVAAEAETVGGDCHPTDLNNGFLDNYGRFMMGDHTYGAIGKDGLSRETSGPAGALKLTHDVLAEMLSRDPATGKIPMLLDPGWSNYNRIFGEQFDIKTYQHLDEAGLYNHQDFMDLLEEAPEHAAVLLQACGYNDDGIERSREQWDEIFDVIKQKRLVPIVDATYAGLAQGLNVHTGDRYAMRKCVDSGVLSFICLSTSVSMGLYDSRPGAMYVANLKNSLSDEAVLKLQSAIESHGKEDEPSPLTSEAIAIARVLRNSNSREELASEIERIRWEVHKRRVNLGHQLGNEGKQVSRGRGLFTRILPGGFSQEQRDALKQDGILALPSAVINIGGIPKGRIERVAESILRVI